MGPDYDIGNSPILVTLPNGKRALFVGTKGADVLALDPDDNGARALPRQPVRRAGRRGPRRTRRRSSGAAPATSGRSITGWARRASARSQPADGKTAWVFTAPGARGRGNAALGAAPTTIPGVVFQGAGDGRLFAVSAADGKQLWEFNTAQPFETVNKVPARKAARSPRPARWWSTGWSTSGRATRSRAARRAATCCWRSGWSSRINDQNTPRHGGTED